MASRVNQPKRALIHTLLITKNDEREKSTIPTFLVFQLKIIIEDYGHQRFHDWVFHDKINDCDFMDE